ncbi:MAG: hypothetical protein V1750_11750 [Acidobacteriota bacterium]
MATVVTLMDRDGWQARTDNIVVVDSQRQRLLWVPRDLWCERMQGRVSEAYRWGGHRILMAALGEHGIAVDASVCLRRAASEQALANLTIMVPVPRLLEFWYPLTPTVPIEDGRKLISFRPPSETLAGERLHQWIGARCNLDGTGSDLARIERQKVLVRRLLEDGFDFGALLANPDWYSLSSPEALAELAGVRASWHFETLSGLAPARVDSKSVLIRDRGSWLARLWRDAIAASAEAAPWHQERGGSLRRQLARLAFCLVQLAKSTLLRYFAVPSWGLPARRGRRVRLLALLAVRNEMRFLPGYLANVAPQVDGIVALDDGSSDGSAELLASRPEVLELVRIPPGRPAWDEVGNYQKLVAAALRHEPQWLISLDSDERVEREFRLRAERVIRRGQALGISGFALRLRELWGSPEHVRVDGLWGRKAPARLFRARADHAFDLRPLHASKTPLQSRFLGGIAHADLIVYHLRMIHPADREVRKARYLQADPQSRWQPGIGYDYLTDESGLRLRRVSRRRGFSE